MTTNHIGALSVKHKIFTFCSISCFSSITHEYRANFCEEMMQLSFGGVFRTTVPVKGLRVFPGVMKNEKGKTSGLPHVKSSGKSLVSM